MRLGKGRSAEVLLVIGEKAETTQTIRIVPTPLSYWICTTFPRERKYRSWFLEEHYDRPLLENYQELAKKFPQGLADVAPLPEELSGAVAVSANQSGNRPRNSMLPVPTRRREVLKMHSLTFVLFGLTFTWFMVSANSPRRVVTVTVAGVLIVTLLMAPPLAEAQGGLVQAIQAVLNVINGIVKNALTAINTARAAINNLYQNLIWPVQLINQARAQVTQMINQYRAIMANILNMSLSSATLPTPQSMETLMRDHRVNNYNALTQTFGNTYGAIPTSADASQADRDMSDMDDALTLDSLKTLKASDNATDLELQAANAIENSASQAAPGSAPFMTASAVASSIRSQALTQKMLAAELRQEAAHIAHQNGFRKRGATFTTQFRTLMMNLLQHN